MNIVIKSIWLLLLPTATVFADSADKEDQSIAFKCHVEVEGGKQVISFWHTSNPDIELLYQTVTNSSIMLRGRLEQTPVFKVFECQRSDHKFKSKRARLLEKKTPR